ncbi:MAG: hypothetical protein HQL95_08850 [Magnetococcales bacterium]|nr:hypothetical protein [Magnetococcales bacterium]
MNALKAVSAIWLEWVEGFNARLGVARTMPVGLTNSDSLDLAELINEIALSKMLARKQCLEGFNPIDQAISMGCECLEGTLRPMLRVG